jgi:hypothetical protein
MTVAYPKIKQTCMSKCTLSARSRRSNQIGNSSIHQITIEAEDPAISHLLQNIRGVIVVAEAPTGRAMSQNLALAEILGCLPTAAPLLVAQYRRHLPLAWPVSMRIAYRAVAFGVSLSG